ncbi:MAG: VWA domain-containing protein [Spirochaetes bacterium]|nr:VWA domain-containing protein [Spirochaetota bacterium]
MKRLLSFTFFFTILNALVLNNGGTGESILTIHEIDAHTNYPHISLKVSLMLSEKMAFEIARQHFTLLENGKEVPILEFTPKDCSNDVVHLVIAVDTSKSITPQQFSKIKNSVENIVTSLPQNYRIALIRFNDHVTPLTGFDSSREHVRLALKTLTREGTKTLLFTAIRDSITRLKDTNAKRGAVWIFTDGKDEGSPIRMDEIIAISKQSGIPIHIVCPTAQHCDAAVKRISLETGGMCIDSLKKLNGGKIIGTLVPARTYYYHLGYTSPHREGGKTHQLELRFSNNQISDRAFAKITTPISKTPFQLPHLIDIVLVVLIIVLIVLLSFLIAFIIRMGNKLFTKNAYKVSEKRTTPNRFTESEVLYRDYPPTLTPRDPEYAYAKAWLIMKDGPETGKKFQIFWDEITLGRDETNSIVIADLAVSLKHAKIKRIKDTYMLFDLVSENGTYLNGKKLLRPKVLCDWDEIKIGRTVLIFRGSKLKD